MTWNSSTKKRIISKLTPTAAERKAETQLARKIITQIEEMNGSHQDAVLAGSLSRNTHLSGDRDLDIFVRYPKSLNREAFEKEGLATGKKAFGKNKFEVAYSEHPYVRGVINGFDVEVVPCYYVENAHEKQSSVDRTVLHTQYLQEKLTDNHVGEIRLLKKFLKSIGCYGADLHAASVPGIVAELLVLQYGTFEKTLEAMSAFKTGQIVDLAEWWETNKAAEKFKPAPLIVIDPIDANRNVAAALSVEVFSRILAASRAFLKKPSEKWFFPPKETMLSAKIVADHVKKEGLLVSVMQYPKGALGDEVWGQIRRFDRKIVSALNEKSFVVQRHDAWTDEEKHIVFVWDLQANTLEKVQKRLGPPVWNAAHSESFLKQHPKPLAGPRIEHDRWVIETNREFSDAMQYLKKILPPMAKHESKHLKMALSKKHLLLNQKELLKFYKKEKGFALYFSGYLKGKEKWVEW